MGDSGVLVTSFPGFVVGIVVLAKSRSSRTRRSIGEIVRRESRWLASRFEETTFRQLRLRYPLDQYVVSAHMLLIDVIGRDSLAGLSPHDRHFAWTAHCDFVVVRLDNLSIERVVEVNGLHHRLTRQIIRDGLKKEILRRHGITLEVV